MTRKTNYIVALLMGGALLASAATYREPWRPQYHFSPATNWINDPNGMVYYEGEYHLFYQYNPFGTKWGHMSWGHAVSKDLVHWEHLPVALYEENDVMIFSGSAVVDWKNTSGLGTNGKPPLIAIYTGHYTKKPLQNQQIAYSNDRGRTWTKYSDNPVLDIGNKDFRDPKVTWHEPTKRWIMSVVLATERKVSFYGSPNLKQWTHLSDFGPAGSTNGIWECPDLFPVRMEGARVGEKWVLIINVGSGGPAGGVGCQYFVGDFDGTKFIHTDEKSPLSQPLWADFGADFYAGVAWSDIPKRDGRRIWIGWMNNWQYANDVPTSPWRGQMSVARELMLRDTGNGIRLVQRPVRELEELRGRRQRLGKASFAEAQAWLAKQNAGLLEAELEVELSEGQAAFGLKLASGEKEETVLRYDPVAKRLSLDRTRSGKTDFHRKFPATHHAPLSAKNGRLKLHLLIDSSSVEVFANDGEVVLTELIFPTGESRTLNLFAEGPAPRVVRMEAWEMKSAWR